jgi:hypothetical protein
LFLVVLAAGIFFGWVAYRVRQFHEQTEFIADLRDRGFRVVVEPVANEWLWRRLVGDLAVQVSEGYLANYDPVSRTYSGPTRDEMEQIAQWDSVRSLTLAGTHITDESLARLESLTRLEMLKLLQSNITDEGTKSLLVLTNLKELEINGGIRYPRKQNEPLNPLSISSEGLRRIVLLPNLVRLHLGPGRFTDDDLALIAD